MEIDKKEYGKYVKQVTPVHNTWKNLWRAFLVGGLIWHCYFRRICKIGR